MAVTGTPFAVAERQAALRVALCGSRRDPDAERRRTQAAACPALETFASRLGCPYALRARFWIPSMLAQPGVIEIRASRNGSWARPDVPAPVEFPVSESAETYLSTRYYSGVMRACPLWDAAPPPPTCGTTRPSSLAGCGRIALRIRPATARWTPGKRGHGLAGGTRRERVKAGGRALIASGNRNKRYSGAHRCLEVKEE